MYHFPGEILYPIPSDANPINFGTSIIFQERDQIFSPSSVIVLSTLHLFLFFI